MLDGHALELKLSQRRGGAGGQQSAAGAGASAARVDPSKMSNKLLVRNIAFEASKKDIRRLFAVGKPTSCRPRLSVPWHSVQAYGNVTAVRLPVKADGTTRGYAFVDFLTKADAANALVGSEDLGQVGLSKLIHWHPTGGAPAHPLVRTTLGEGGRVQARLPAAVLLASGCGACGG